MCSQQRARNSGRFSIKPSRSTWLHFYQRVSPIWMFAESSGSTARFLLFLKVPFRLSTTFLVSWSSSGYHVGCNLLREYFVFYSVLPSIGPFRYFAMGIMIGGLIFWSRDFQRSLSFWRLAVLMLRLAVSIIAYRLFLGHHYQEYEHIVRYMTQSSETHILCDSLLGFLFTQSLSLHLQDFRSFYWLLESS